MKKIIWIILALLFVGACVALILFLGKGDKVVPKINKSEIQTMQVASFTEKATKPVATEEIQTVLRFIKKIRTAGETSVDAATMKANGIIDIVKTDGTKHEFVFAVGYVKIDGTWYLLKNTDIDFDTLYRDMSAQPQTWLRGR